MSNFDKYYLETMKERYADFYGRATRSEFWYLYLFYVLIILGASIAFNMISARLALPMVMLIFLGHVIPVLAALVRRLHDTSRSGWWFLISFIPVIGTIVLIVFLAQEGDEYENDWGPNPLNEEFY
jgi:uncharacterized membrane protein YhaH (DUF805 family)